MYVYMESEKGLYTVGFYSPTGEWQPENDYDNKENAASRVHYLNGGNSFGVWGQPVNYVVEKRK